MDTVTRRPTRTMKESYPDVEHDGLSAFVGRDAGTGFASERPASPDPAPSPARAGSRRSRL
jgi:hypothetical protein